MLDFEFSSWCSRWLCLAFRRLTVINKTKCSRGVFMSCLHAQRSAMHNKEYARYIPSWHRHMTAIMRRSQAQLSFTPPLRHATHLS